MLAMKWLSYRLPQPLLVPVFLWFHYVVAKHEAYFADDPDLVVVHAQVTEDGTRREAARVNPRNVAASESSRCFELTFANVFEPVNLGDS
jgi:hypothetical protein